MRALTGLNRKAFDELLGAFCVQLELEAIRLTPRSAIALLPKTKTPNSGRRKKSTIATGFIQVIFYQVQL
ncbi:MAG: hypothetical protein F6K39_25485 [Okeania sp. SIO3B3]|nr:hypothetical protein [Okeania sp. SIO3B3]